MTAVAASPERQTLTLATKETLSARLVVMATGLNIGLRHMLGVEREVLSANHSISVGFDMRPAAGSRFPFRALTYYPDRTEDRMAYMTLFPVQSGTRANLFVYRDMTDPLLRHLRTDPHAALLTLMPELERVTGPFEVEGFVKIRPVDLCRMHNPLHAGVVLVGDAFATSCPAAGTGMNKVLTDVERLCNHHIPQWLATPGMDVEKIEGFYADPQKIETDTHSLEKAFHLRSLSTDTSPIWQARRLSRRIGHTAFGFLRRLTGRSMRSTGPATALDGAAGDLLMTVPPSLAVSTAPSAMEPMAVADAPSRQDR